MIYVIDHNDSFTHNVVHQFSLFDKVYCDNYNQLNKKKLEEASVIIFSPGPGNPKNYPLTSKIYKQYKGKKRIIGICLGFQQILFCEGAKIIEQKLKDINSSKVHLKSITIDKKNPNQISEFDINFNQMPKSVYLVDDVLNTGKTLMFAVNSLLKYDFNLIKTLVLIDRNHKRYPIKVDFKGISLSTNLDDTVKLISENKNLEAVLV